MCITDPGSRSQGQNLTLNQPSIYSLCTRLTLVYTHYVEPLYRVYLYIGLLRMRANEGLERGVENFDGRKRKDTGLAESSRNCVLLEVLDLKFFFRPGFFFATCPSFFVARCPTTNTRTHTQSRTPRSLGPEPLCS